MNIIKEKNLNVSEISRKTGIPATRIYKWLDNKGKPKGDDTTTMQKWAAENLEEVPNFKNDGFPKMGTIADQTLLILSRVVEAQQIILEDIRNNMARQESQAMLADTVKRMDANLIETLTGVETLSKRQKDSIKQIRADLSELKGQNNLPRPIGGKK